MPQGTRGGGFIAWLRMRIIAFRQTPDQVFRRNAGSRSLVGPYPVEDSARRDWQFAMLSVAAYGRSHPKRDPLPVGVGVIKATASMLRYQNDKKTPVADIDDILGKAGWKLWSDFPDPILAKEMKCSHLRAEVWEHKDTAAIAVAFGGTVFTSGKDWLSNLRWFFPWHEDEYTEIVSRFSPDFVKSLAKRIDAGSPNNPDYWGKIRIYSTGHSLGGGLAQQFAYSLPREPKVPRVSEVYAFDPSPVTGYRSVDRKLRNANKRDLKIGRIYERGEILAIVRSFTSLVIKPSSRHPEIRGSRFSLLHRSNAIADHSMEKLAHRMKQAANIDGLT